jgi:hypothetical protein
LPENREESMNYEHEDEIIFFRLKGRFSSRLMQLENRLEKSFKNWCVPFGTQRVETEDVSNNEQRHERNPKAESHPGTNQA